MRNLRSRLILLTSQHIIATVMFGLWLRYRLRKRCMKGVLESVPETRAILKHSQVRPIIE